MLLLFSTSAFAVCEQQQSEYEDWNSKCEKLSAASQIAGVAGGFFAVATFGLSMAPCAAAIATAQNACRIRDEKKNNLDHCFKAEAENAAARLVAASKALEAEKAKKELIKKIKKKYEDLLKAFIQDYIDQGYDIETPEAKEEINKERSRLAEEMEKELRQRT